MSVDPPASGRPTGPPSGPLSGPDRPASGPGGPGSQPPSQPPSGPPSQPSGGGEGPGPRRPWWRSGPRIAVAAAAVVAAVVVAVVLTRPDGGSSGSGGEVFLQAAGETGPEPFTESTANDSSAPPASSSPAPSTASPNTVRGVEGGEPGLYGGTRNASACDVEKQVKALQTQPDKNRAFASVADVAPDAVPGYLRSLTPVQLRMDTRVTNHGYRDGSATSYQAVLQAGTAVLVDDRGVPRVRCACGNPLTPPVAQQGTLKTTGDSWPGYSSSNVVVVTPAPVVINVFVLFDPEHDEWISRHAGDTGGKDEPTSPPTSEPPSTPPSSPSSGSSEPSTPSEPSSPSAPSSPPSTPPTSPQGPTSEAPASPAEPPGTQSQPQSEPQPVSPRSASPATSGSTGGPAPGLM